MNRMNRGGDFNSNFEQQQQQQHQKQQQQQQFRGGKGIRKGNENRTSRGSSNSNSNKSSNNGKGNHDRRSNNTTNTNSSSGKGNHDRFSSRRSKSISADGGGISGGNNRTSQRRGSNSRSTQRTSTAGSKQSNGGASRMSRGSTKSRGSTNTNNTRTSNSTSNSTSNDNNNSAIVPKDMNKMMKMKMKKKTVSQKEPSEEIIAIFGAYGVTGHHFVKFAIEAGYQIRVLMLPGMEKMNDDDLFSSNTCYSVTLITGSFEEEDKIRQVVEQATYVVCLLNDCGEYYDPHQQENLRPPVGNIDNHNYNNNNPDNNDDYSSSSPFSLNLNFMHNLVPILEESDTCRVLLYQASSVALDEKGTAPMLSKMVKTLAVRKNWRDMKREQDKIVQYIVNQTKQTPFNYIITRPNESMIRDKASRKELAASKSQPGPFPITNIDLAEFTLGALRMKKVYNSCPYVV